MLAFVFPGQGAQKVGMGKEVYEAFSEARDVFAQADEALGFSIRQICFEGPEEALQLTANAQPAILTASIATLRAIETHTEAKASVVAGHSLGEYSALVAANALSFADAVRAVHKRGQFMQEAVPVGEGAMAAVMGIQPDDVEALCRDGAQGRVLCPANYNAPGQIVIAGHTDAIERAGTLAKERGGMVKTLKVSAPFHCPLMEPAAGRLREELGRIAFRQPALTVISNVKGAAYESEDSIADLLVRQVTAPVRWTASVQEMVKLGVKEAIEIGPGKVLTGLIKRISSELKFSNVESAADVEAANWELFDDRKVRRDGWKIIWNDGMVWDADEPGAFGF